MVLENVGSLTAQMFPSVASSEAFRFRVPQSFTKLIEDIGAGGVVSVGGDERRGDAEPTGRSPRAGTEPAGGEQPFTRG